MKQYYNTDRGDLNNKTLGTKENILILWFECVNYSGDLNYRHSVNRWSVLFRPLQEGVVVSYGESMTYLIASLQ